MQLNPQIFDSLIALLTGAGGVGILSFVFNRKKTTAETHLAEVSADSLMSNSAISYAQLLRSELETLKNDSTKMFERIQRLEAHVQVLEDHIRLLTQFNERLRSALKEYNPIHPLLSESIPAIPDVL